MSDVERTNTFRRIEFVASNREQIDAEFVDLCRDLSDRLRCVGVKTDAMLTRNRADFLDRLDGADLVVRVHDADQDRLRRDGAAHILRIDPARPVHRQVSDRAARQNGSEQEQRDARSPR